MKLTKNERTILAKWGHDESEIERIQWAAEFTNYERNGVGISEENAKRLLGTEKWLSGLSRSAFHWTSYRLDRYGKGISFDSSMLFEIANPREFLHL